jgi:hypothetical protein
VLKGPRPPPVAVTVQSSDGTAVPVADTQISLAISSGVGTLTGVRTASTNASGVATFPGLSIDKSGPDFKLSATGTGLVFGVERPVRCHRRGGHQTGLYHGPCGRRCLYKGEPRKDHRPTPGRLR